MAKRKTKKETPPYELVKMSDLPDERQERTKVIVLDKKIGRKIKKGEEQKLEKIASEKAK
jgi:hypothetical protein